MRVNTMPRKKHVSNDLREAIVTTHESGKGYRSFSIILSCTVRRIIHKWRTFKTVVNLPRSVRSFLPPSKFTPKSDRAMLRETENKKKARATSQTLQASVNMLKFMTVQLEIK